MHTPNDCQNSRFTDPEWYFFAQYPLNKLFVDLDIRAQSEARFLFRTIRDLGVHPEIFTNIQRKIIAIADERMKQTGHEGYQNPAYIRLFFHKKVIEGINSRKSSQRIKAIHIIKSSQITLNSNPGMNGGWGYFVVQRPGGSLPGAPMNANYYVDIFLYRE